jgi:hypothetical protein
MRIAVMGAVILIATAAAAPGRCGDAPSALAQSPAAGAPAAGAARQAVPAVGVERRTADPAVCASLCRLFEFLGSLERRKPADSPPTS